MKLINQSHRPGGALIGVPNQAPRPRSGSVPSQDIKESKPTPVPELEEADEDSHPPVSPQSREPSISAQPLDLEVPHAEPKKTSKFKSRKIKSIKTRQDDAPKIESYAADFTSPPESRFSSISSEGEAPVQSKIEDSKASAKNINAAASLSPKEEPLTEQEESPASATKKHIAATVHARREGDDAAIKPTENPRRMRPLTQEDQVKLKKIESQREEEVEEEITAPWLFRSLRWLFGPALSSFFLLGVCVFGLFVYSQVLSILSQLATLPMWAQSVGMAALAFLGSIGGWVILRFLSMYLKLRQNKQFSLKSLTDRSEMRKLRWKHVQKCKRSLSDYLAKQKFDDPQHRKDLLLAGLSEEQLKSLSFARKSLLDQELRIESQGWVKRFYEEFQKQLDEAADQEIRRHATKVGVKTAVSPIPLIDAIVAIYHTFSLFHSLCKIYQVRLNVMGTLYLIGLAFFSAYLTGKLEEGVEDLSDAITENSSHVLAGFSRVVTPKLAEGFGAALLVNRLGKEAKKRLQPLSPK